MNDKLYILKRKPKKYRTIRPVSKSNRKIVTHQAKSLPPNTHIHDWLSWLVAGASIKYGEVKLVL
jgi:hypothetical protein